MSSTAVFDRLSAIADPTRSRLLALLEDHELTVSELCAVVQLPQSTVSRHLKVLSDEGWVTVRGAGTSRFYRMAPTRHDPFPHRLWNVVRGQVEETHADSSGRAPARERAARPPRPLQTLLHDRRRRLEPDPLGSHRVANRSARAARPARPVTRRRRPGMRHRPDHRSARAVREAGRGRGRVGGHAQRRPPAVRSRRERGGARGSPGVASAGRRRTRRRRDVSGAPLRGRTAPRVRRSASCAQAATVAC